MRRRRQAKRTSPVPLTLSIIFLAVVVLSGSLMFAWLFQASAVSRPSADLVGFTSTQTVLIPLTSPDAAGR